MADLTLRVDGVEYGGWKSVRVTRGIESVAGSFDLSYSDRWVGQRTPWPINEEDECALVIDGTPILSGYVDKRSISYSATQHSLRVSGRDQTGALVDCSVVGPWSFRALPLSVLVQRLVEPFGIPVSVEPGLTLPAPAGKFTLTPGETVGTALDRACRLSGVLPVSDGEGGLVLTRVGVARAVTPLVEGQNILAATGDYDASGRFRRYVVSTQHQGSDAWSGGSAAGVTAEAQDETVRRPSRVLYVRPEAGMTRATARTRAEWEAKVRAARGDTVTVTVQGWQQGDGSLWPVNALVRLRSPLLGMDGDLLITQATYSLDDSGTTTVLALRRPDAFTPEPVVKKPVAGSGGGGGLWKEIAHGV